jgi:uncharacterized FlaG/YvyC family protein
MHPNTLPLIRRESIEHAVVEIDELLEKFLRGIEFNRESRLGEVDLDIISAVVQAPSDIRSRFRD